MGVIELKPTLLEGTGDQNREDSGENLNILPSRTQGVTTIAVALLFKSHFWASTKKPFTKLKITRESQVWGTVAVALQHLIKTWFRSWEVRGAL